MLPYTFIKHFLLGGLKHPRIIVWTFDLSHIEMCCTAIISTLMYLSSQTFLTSIAYKYMILASKCWRCKKQSKSQGGREIIPTNVEKVLKSGVRPRISVGCLKYSLTSFLIEKARGFGTMLKYISNVLCVIDIILFHFIPARLMESFLFEKIKTGVFLNCVISSDTVWH